MLLLTSTSDTVRVTTGSAANAIEVHASYVDNASGVITPGRTNTLITTATTTIVVPSPGASVQRNLKGLYVTNDSVSTTCLVGVEHTDGTNVVEIMQFNLLPGENMTFNEDGGWRHRDANGAEYPPVGLGAYNGRSVTFMKNGTGADAVGYWYSTAKDAGFPGAWAPGTPGVNGRMTDGTTAADNGCLVIANPSVGGNYVTEVIMGTSTNHQNLFYDCLWVNSGLVVTTTTAQTITMGTLPARDVNGSTNGEGCMIALLVTTALGTAALTFAPTISYTNSDGTAGRTATLSNIVGSQMPATPAIGTLVWFNLAAGDKGVRSIQSITQNITFTSGAYSLMICRDVATIGTTIVNISATRTMPNPGVRIYNGSCILHCNLASATTATFYSGELTVMER
jgi:hypothetical protein